MKKGTRPLLVARAATVKDHRLVGKVILSPSQRLEM